MRPAAALALLWAGAAQAQTLAPFETKDLVYTVLDVGGGAQGTGGRQTGIEPATRDLVFTVQDVGGGAMAVAGQTKDLEVKETATEIRIELSADVLFDFDKSNIKPEAATALHNVAEIIREKSKGRAVKINGYTDSKGNDPYNQKLSERRAASVKEWLMQKEGLAKVNMTTEGFGAKNPVAANRKPDGSDDPEGRQKNRRVEIVVAK
jgi:outer membrane protein OmpA-like peptidoglycan-associated protein